LNLWTTETTVDTQETAFTQHLQRAQPEHAASTSLRASLTVPPTWACTQLISMRCSHVAQGITHVVLVHLHTAYPK
jgi:hypothetical protein